MTLYKNESGTPFKQRRFATSSNKANYSLHGIVGGFRQVFSSSIILLACSCALAQSAEALSTSSTASSPSNPVLATFDGGKITLRDFEEYTREMPVDQRIPFAKGVGEWREFMCGNFAEMIALTNQAREMGLHLDPGYLRARDYFINEYMSFLVLRDEVTNRMDVSPDVQKMEYETHKSDFYLSPTVSLRVIRSRNADQISSAAKALKDGGDFQKVELEYSQVSPRYRGHLLGPFPSRSDKVVIPPPDEVVAVAMGLKPGETTGPLTVGAFHFLIKTESKTPGRQQTPVEVTEQLEDRVRTDQSTIMLPNLVDKIKDELGVVVDEELFASPQTKADDLLATIGALKIYRSEYTDLNGNVRGPAARIASMMPTDLKKFVLPYMLSEWAKVHGFMDREETKKAIYYYDLQHLAARVEYEIAEKIAPTPTDEELRSKFNANIDEFRTKGGPEPRFEDHKQDMLNVVMQEKIPETTRQIKHTILSKINFRMAADPTCTNITAIEALLAAGKDIPANARLLSVSPAKLVENPDGSTPYEFIGRAPEWQISTTLADGSNSVFRVEGPTPLLKNLDGFSSGSAFGKWTGLCRFDTDALKRQAIDKSVGEFVAKYKGHTKVGVRVDFSYSKDDPTSPTDCQIVYTAVPVDLSIKDGVEMRYSGYSGDVTRRRLGDPQLKCLTCPQASATAVVTTETLISGSETSASLVQ